MTSQLIFYIGTICTITFAGAMLDISIRRAKEEILKELRNGK